jgi:transcriptional regulator with XRE-family HTH domain
MKVTIEVEVVGVGAVLREARSALRISQAAAGMRMGQTGSNFFRLENEEHKSVPLETLRQAFEAVGLDLVQCLGEWVVQIPDTVTVKQSMKGVEEK